MKQLVCKDDSVYPQEAYEYVTVPRDYAKPAAIGGAAAAGFGALALNNARLLPKRSKIALDRANEKAKAARDASDKATQAASRAHAQVPKAKLNPFHHTRLKSANKLSETARTARNATVASEGAAISARRAMGTVRARQRTGLKTGLGAIGLGTGLVALAARNRKKRQEAGY